MAKGRTLAVATKKMPLTLNYNIHDALKITFVRSKKHRLNAIKRLNSPFDFFESSEHEGAADILVNVGKFTPSNRGCSVVEHKYHVKENYLYCRDKAGPATWELEIFGFEDGKTTINVDPRFKGPELILSDLLFQEMLLMPVVAYKLSKKRHYLLHAGGVCDSEHGYLFAGRGGSFKTALVLDFVRSGFRLLGDDWVILHGGQIQAFPKHLSQFLFSYDAGYFPTERDSTITDKVRYLGWLLRNSPRSRDTSLVTSRSDFTGLFLVVKHTSNTVSARTIDSVEASDRLIANNALELLRNPNFFGKTFGKFYNYMLAYSFVYPESQISRYWLDLARDLEKLIRDSNARVRELTLPKTYDLSVFDQVRKLLNT